MIKQTRKSLPDFIDRVVQPHNLVILMIPIVISLGLWLILASTAKTPEGLVIALSYSGFSALVFIDLGKALYREIRELYRKTQEPPKVEYVVREIERRVEVTEPPCASLHERVDLPKATGEYVYVIQDIDVTRYCKIGHTDNLHRRIGRFEVVLPFHVRCIHVIECTNRQTVEASLHRHFSTKRVSGEWFKLTDADIAMLKAIKRTLS